jgi:hypothetical protein
MKTVKWFDKKGEKVVVRTFTGMFESETETTVTFKYGKGTKTLNKGCCIIY